MQLRRTILALIIGLTGILSVPASSLAAVLPNAAPGPAAVVVQVASADSAKLASRPSAEATFSEKTHIRAINQNQPKTHPAYHLLAADSQQVALSKYLYDASGYTVAPGNIARDSRGNQLLLEGPSLGKSNAVRGNNFERSVYQAVGATKGSTPVSHLTSHKTTIPDFNIGTRYGVTDIKDVKRLSFSRQLRAQAAAADTGSLPFNLVISPRTLTISRPLQQAVRARGGIIVQFDSATGTFSKVTLNGNKVAR